MNLCEELGNRRERCVRPSEKEGRPCRIPEAGRGPRRGTLLLAGGLLAVLPGGSEGQVGPEEYERAFSLAARYENLAVDLPGPVTWAPDGDRFRYRKTTADGSVFMEVDPERLEKREAFDHEALARALSIAAGREVQGRALPFSSFDREEGGEISFRAFGREWSCDPVTLRCADLGRAIAPPAVNPVGIGHRGPDASAHSEAGVLSPDGRWEVYIRDYNVYLRPAEGGAGRRLSWDGNESDFYTAESISWAPDSRKFAAYRLQPGYRRSLPYVRSASDDRLQPELSGIAYTKPGDVLDQNRPVLFHLEGDRQIRIEEDLFRDQFALSPIVWRADSRAFSFEHNQRGHKVYRVIEVDGETGEPRVVVDERAETFFFYQGRYRGKIFRHDVEDGREVIWASERDGWNHLYLLDGTTGEVLRQITRGEWVVREVDHVDDRSRRIWFQASGMDPAQDPYFIHHYRIDFDGTGLVRLTEGDANHTAAFSPDMRHYVVTRSRPDLPPTMELRRTEDQRLLLTVESTDISALEAAGWRAPEAFSAKGRDGTTDIWGLIYRPSDFDPSRRYPVIEQIYAGPQNSSVPKSFAVYNPVRSLAELGFVVVQIDGMGTNNRSKAFHDVAYRNLQDAGLPDRILWHRAVADRYPWYDISRVGIYGGSAGGQNTVSALLFHRDFYKVGVSTNGNHDNRMDKISFNELFMGWPIGPAYSEASNAENAWRLQGRLLLILGEMDENVDPSSTLQVVDGLIRAERDFDFLMVPNGGHGIGGRYADRWRYDYFVRHLLGVEPPDWNALTRHDEDPSRRW